jgi:hypothetical protein
MCVSCVDVISFKKSNTPGRRLTRAEPEGPSRTVNDSTDPVDAVETDDDFGAKEVFWT